MLTRHSNQQICMDIRAREQFIEGFKTQEGRGEFGMYEVSKS